MTNLNQSNLSKATSTLKNKEEIIQNVRILNTPTLNQVFSINPNQSPNKINKALGNEAQFFLQSANKDDDAIFYIENYTQGNHFKLDAKKILDFIILRFSERNSYKQNDSKINMEVVFSLEEYAEVLGRRNPKSSSTKRDVRRIVKEALDIIYSCSIETYEKRGGEIQKFSKMRILQDYTIKNGVCTVNLGIKFAEYMNRSYIMNFPMSLFKLDGRNSNAYCVARRLSVHQSILNNKKKGTNKIISVNSLLKAAPCIPTIEEVRSSNCSWSHRIEDKLTDTLDKLTDSNGQVEIKILESWCYCNSKGAPISDEQLLDMNYYSFSNLYVNFSVCGID